MHTGTTVDRLDGMSFEAALADVAQLVKNRLGHLQQTDPLGFTKACEDQARRLEELVINEGAMAEGFRQCMRELMDERDRGVSLVQYTHLLARVRSGRGRPGFALILASRFLGVDRSWARFSASSCAAGTRVARPSISTS
jgi:hypothetical protein